MHRKAHRRIFIVMKQWWRSLFFLFLIGPILFSCRKEGFTDSPDARLRTGIDSLHFDTVFTTTGSVSGVIKIFNDNNKGIRVSSIRLGGGAASPFKINVDGTPGPVVNNIDIAADDSVYIFVTVTINPAAGNLPFVVRDSIAINYNGNTEYVQLDAYGQNAHFFRNRVIRTNEIWNNDLPYVILGGVTVDTTATLNINKGVKVFMHADAPFIVNGSLKVMGEGWDSTRVVFASDRLDEPYRNYPAGYPGLIFTNTSRNNVLNYAIIKNAYQGIVVAEQSVGTKLTLNETVIDNAYDAGLIGINTSITARNLLVSNCGKNLVLVKGGTYNFTHCTVATYSNAFIQHRDPVLFLANYLQQGVTAPLTATFRNCIFWGEDNGIVADEVVVAKQGNTAFNVVFDAVLWRVRNAPTAAGVTTAGILNNQSPGFDSINISGRFYNFRLKAASPAVNKGVTTGINLDLDGNGRPVGLPDLGAYERQ
ncbi:MAG: hypothetical protein JWP69_2204 [Flaviaesturariibacter sp.]|nr:hypothetical protein [Flaviaesturariibacter sp.]